jgi:hypothetical protein
MPGEAQAEPCLTDAAPKTAPGMPSVESRYAEVRSCPAAIIAAGF